MLFKGSSRGEEGQRIYYILEVKRMYPSPPPQEFLLDKLYPAVILLVMISDISAFINGNF